jgi:hypothetical protein
MGIILFLVIYVPIYLIVMGLFVIITEHYYIEKKNDDEKQLV